ncbi:transcriptional regulator [Pseudonocardia sulfidoxydans NBRC 16205]|uniref:Transcriptional regulator n=1 Tax=Pseudonocardia sulfidoxydans NBRC 16205 TaxID=1223511 RepID=A0A511DIP2_9PSEU|nr:MerR family transcriptional regulator [Pseudonocardia sulfidoxydans]GEL23624.1 transcriptional regulator [Pseudonocardia sulfidoxydans NBRC 16205]
MLIGDVARRSGVSARMLRHYDALGLARPTGRTGAGYREYSEADIRRILHIEILRSLGLSLREVGRALDEPGFTPSDLVDDLVVRTRERIARETELLTRLRRISAAEPVGWEEVLQVIALLQGLGSDSAGRRQRAALSADDVAVPVEALVEAALSETDPNVAGALRWALERSGTGGLALLADALSSPDSDVRRRAVEAVAELPDEAATPVLRGALASDDLVVRRRAALLLGSRGVAGTAPTLVDMIVAGVDDVDAADALSILAAEPTERAEPTEWAEPTERAEPTEPAEATEWAGPAEPGAADEIATMLVDRLADEGLDAATRRRLTQAFAGIPGPVASHALAELVADDDPGVAATATYVSTLRDTE